MQSGAGGGSRDITYVYFVADGVQWRVGLDSEGVLHTDTDASLTYEGEAQAIPDDAAAKHYIITRGDKPLSATVAVLIRDDLTSLVGQPYDIDVLQEAPLMVGEKPFGVDPDINDLSTIWVAPSKEDESSPEADAVEEPSAAAE